MHVNDGTSPPHTSSQLRVDPASSTTHRVPCGVGDGVGAGVGGSVGVGVGEGQAKPSMSFLASTKHSACGITLGYNT